MYSLPFSVIPVAVNSRSSLHPNLELAFTSPFLLSSSSAFPMSLTEYLLHSGDAMTSLKLTFFSFSAHYSGTAVYSSHKSR